MPTHTVSLYDQAIQISEEYLGPAGERFMRRQISTHLGIKPEALKKSQMPQLVTWVSLAFALLTNNAEEQEGFTHSLLSLSSNSDR